MDMDCRKSGCRPGTHQGGVVSARPNPRPLPCATKSPGRGAFGRMRGVMGERLFPSPAASLTGEGGPEARVREAAIAGGGRRRGWGSRGICFWVGSIGNESFRAGAVEWRFEERAIHEKGAKAHHEFTNTTRLPFLRKRGELFGFCPSPAAALTGGGGGRPGGDPSTGAGRLGFVAILLLRGWYSFYKKNCQRILPALRLGSGLYRHCVASRHHVADGLGAPRHPDHGQALTACGLCGC